VSADEIHTTEGNYQTKPPAIILDVDETVLDNSAYNARNIRDGKLFTLEAWNAWCEEQRAIAIPGAVEFIQRAESLGVKVFFITDREDDVRAATIENLNKIGVRASEENVLTKNPQLDDKISRRALVTQNHRVLLLIGDSMSDLCSGMGTREWDQRQKIAAEKTALFGPRWVMLPNPVYGSWQRALPPKDNGLRLN
jgi:acid phosphatase